MIVPSAASAAKPTVSESVGCGWIVSPMSSASAPISMRVHRLGDQLAGVDADDAGAEQRRVSGSKSSLVMPFVAAERQRAAGRRPGERRLLVVDALGLGLGLGQARPGDLGIGVGDRGDRARVEA